jgi:hypothetical protein
MLISNLNIWSFANIYTDCCCFTIVVFTADLRRRQKHSDFAIQHDFKKECLQEETQDNQLNIAIFRLQVCGQQQ